MAYNTFPFKNNKIINLIYLRALDPKNYKKAVVKSDSVEFVLNKMFVLSKNNWYAKDMSTYCKVSFC